MKAFALSFEMKKENVVFVNTRELAVAIRKCVLNEMAKMKMKAKIKYLQEERGWSVISYFQFPPE